MKPAKSIRHQLTTVPGVSLCGAREADGAILNKRSRLVTCEKCLARRAKFRDRAVARVKAMGIQHV